MKLTLRTLLAYLDDRLSPGNARELGQKLAKSPFAMELAERLKDVVRRRRLASESAEQKTIDGNLIAEYLDDQLTPELVALIEKEILSSDHALAEVAATHQILGLLSDPVEIDSGLRGRLYKLDPAIARESTETEGDGAAAHPAKDAEWTPLQKQTEPQKRSPMLLLAAMVLGWLGLLASDSNLFQRRDRQVAQGDAAPAAGIEDNAAPADVAPEDDVDATKQAVVPEVASLEPKPMSTAPAVADAAQPDPSGNAAAVPNVVNPAVAATTGPITTGTATGESATMVKPMVPSVDATTAAGAEKPIVTDPPDNSEPVVAITTTARFELIDRNGMVALRDPDQEAWIWASSLGIDPTASWTKPLSRSYATVAQPFSARVVAPKVGWSAQLLGPSVFQTASLPTPGLRVVEGRILLRRYATDAPVTFRLFTGRRTLDISVPEVDDVVGIEILMQPASDLSVEPAEDEPSFLYPIDNNRVVRISAADGDVEVTVGESGERVKIPRGSEWIWDTANDIFTAGAVTVNAAIPEWLFAARNPPIELQANLIAETVAAYPQSESVTGAALSLSENKNPQIAEYGVQQLALLRSVDDLTTIMLQTNEDPTRRAAIAGLQKIVQQGPADAQRVLAALETRLPEMELDNAMTMLQGVTRSGAEDRRTSEFLVSMLEHNRVALRALAIFNLERLTNERFGFFASDDTGRRDAAIRRWKRLLDRNDGRIIAPGE